MPRLPASLSRLPGASQRWRALLLTAAGLTCWLLRPLWPLRLLPGWAVGLLLLLALVAWCRVLWSPRRWRT
ncbi:hypothetical protein EVJ50_08510 [Synechococcus sp. RSCCF101]|uniref:hypothetical protein n=1 Tax=Synechococcus sp. RSCCF101 TaxID=2511069 RepID=UPI0012471CB5|nr:hypothetical protein [Synechococcus sp. RSCCF101]QEY32257.1 hypothetical protein EVJ50_08510 [Synechococcus sp. RSCCF101]